MVVGEFRAFSSPEYRSSVELVQMLLSLRREGWEVRHRNPMLKLHTGHIRKLTILLFHELEASCLRLRLGGKGHGHDSGLKPVPLSV